MKLKGLCLCVDKQRYREDEGGLVLTWGPQGGRAYLGKCRPVPQSRRGSVQDAASATKLEARHLRA